jgi:hypothetical protein
MSHSSDEDSVPRVTTKRVTTVDEGTETDSLLPHYTSDFKLLSDGGSFRPVNSKRVVTYADEATELDDLLPDPCADGTSRHFVTFVTFFFY